jgi:hypothetical protein
MNLVTILLGVASLGYGAYTAWARRAKPEQFGKLEPMKKLWGEQAGPIVHLLGYTVMPILLGAVLVYLGVRGVKVL